MTACGVDIPWHHYEVSLGGFAWLPLENVMLNEAHVEVWALRLEDVMEE